MITRPPRSPKPLYHVRAHYRKGYGGKQQYVPAHTRGTEYPDGEPSYTSDAIFENMVEHLTSQPNKQEGVITTTSITDELSKELGQLHTDLRHLTFLAKRLIK